MGSCKDEMKPKKTKTTKKEEEEKGPTTLFGKVKNWKRKKETVEEAATSFTDHVEMSYEKIGKLVATKEGELNSESGKENYNQRALVRLKTMAFHLEEIMDLAVEYGGDS